METEDGISVVEITMPFLGVTFLCHWEGWYLKEGLKFYTSLVHSAECSEGTLSSGAESILCPTPHQQNAQWFDT